MIDAFEQALALAKEDEALKSAIDESGNVSLSMLDDGGVNVSSGSESVDFSAADLMGDEEGEDEESMPPMAS
jgi:hypothetical protein